MLYEPSRHEALKVMAWDETRARDVVGRIVRETEGQFSATRYWPMHPKDADIGEREFVTPLYHGAAGVIWALCYLERVGACAPTRRYDAVLPALIEANRAWLDSCAWLDGGAKGAAGSYLMGDLGLLLLQHRLQPSAEVAEHLARLIEANIDHPTRELMWGAPGTLLAALFLFESTREARWSELFRKTAASLWSRLLWSPEYQCHYWTQDMYGKSSTYLDAVHGFVATAVPLIRGRSLLQPGDWEAWQRCIVTTIGRSASREANQANWRAHLYSSAGAPMLMQFCHGAPGFVVCLGDLPSPELDALLRAAGEATWAAGPLIKGSNLCHGTGGNGYAFLKLYRRFGDTFWLERARAFAMHAIEQTEADAREFGQMRFSLWTGDPGLAIYLWDCVRERAEFPTLDTFFI